MSTASVDWEPLGIPGMVDVIERAAAECHRIYPNTTEFEDLVQDAVILVATKADLRECVEGTVQLGLLHHRLLCDLKDGAKTLDKHLGSRLSFERLVEGCD